MAEKPNSEKQRSVIYPALHVHLERYSIIVLQCNAMQLHGPKNKKKSYVV